MFVPQPSQARTQAKNPCEKSGDLGRLPGRAALSGGSAAADRKRRGRAPPREEVGGEELVMGVVSMDRRWNKDRQPGERLSHTGHL